MAKRMTFDFDMFVSLNGLELCEYMEPMLNASVIDISQRDLERMRDELSTYDEYHLVYALTLGVSYSTDIFVAKLPGYLVHNQSSVWSCAIRTIRELPERCITDQFVHEVECIQQANPTKPWIGDVLACLKKRARRAGWDSKNRIVRKDKTSDEVADEED